MHGNEKQIRSFLFSAANQNRARNYYKCLQIEPTLSILQWTTVEATNLLHLDRFIYSRDPEFYNSY